MATRREQRGHCLRPGTVPALPSRCPPPKTPPGVRARRADLPGERSCGAGRGPGCGLRCGRDARGAGDSSPGAPGAAERSSAGRAPVGRAGSGCRDRRCRDSGGSEALTYSRGSIAAAALGAVRAAPGFMNEPEPPPRGAGVTWGRGCPEPACTGAARAGPARTPAPPAPRPRMAAPPTGPAQTPRVNNRAGRGTTAPRRPRGRDDVTSSAAALPFGPRSPRRKVRRELQSRRPPRAVRSPFAAAAAAAAAAAMIRARQLLRLAALPPPRARSYADAAAGPAAMAFTFASPTQVFYNGTTVKQVDVPTLTGSFGILASHVPTLQVLKPGVVTVYAEDGTATKYFVSSGSVTVNADSTVQVLAEEAVTMDMLDLATAKSNLEKAVSEMAAASDEAARAEAQIKVEANEALVKALE
eukprot:XP_015155437.1 ATP synthase subunit delta, mitochondrial [Gallus gallus]